MTKMTRMIRPCSITYPVVVNGGKPFEAKKMDLAFHIFDLELSISNYDEENGGFIFYESFKFNTLKELEDAKYNVQWQLGKALNAPVRITQEVLEVAKKEYLDDSYYYRVDENARFSTDETFLRNVNPIHLLGMEILPTCPLSLDFLLKFYTDGTPVVVQ